MPSHKEIEIKLPLTNVADFKRRLRLLKARGGKRVFESNTLFDTPDQQFRKRDELVRLRLNDGKGVLTFKGRSLPEPKGRNRKYKVRREEEFAVSNPKTLSEVLRRMGLVESFRYEKYRTEIRLPGISAHVYLDETPIGAFLEVEGAPASIDKAARRLGFFVADYETKSYLALYAEDCARRGRPLRNLVFTNRKKLRLPSVLR